MKARDKTKEQLIGANKKLKREIEERRRAEKGAYYEQGLMQTLLSNIPDYVYFKDKNRRFVRASNSFCDLFGCSLEEIIGKKDEDLFPKEIAEETASDVPQLMQNFASAGFSVTQVGQVTLNPFLATQHRELAASTG